ncbi:MAG: hypothetical protein P8H03_01410 [Emcibacteraceae bacterium]|nr:hypothetical protein [Emcibacteraceae bacterium]MDG1857726.1 hypothetical protein [Emcibacteraceae bacterium]
MTKDKNEPSKSDNKEITQDNFTIDKKSKKNTAPQKSSSNLALKALLLLILFLLGSAVGIYFLPTLKERLPIVATWIGQDDNQTLETINQAIDNQKNALSALQQKSVEQEKRLNQLSLNSNTNELQNLNDRLSSLEETLSVEVPQTDMATDTSQSTRIDMLLSRMSQLEAAFIPLSKNMLDGAVAEKEREQLKEDSGTLSEKMTSLENRLVDLETHAAKDNSGLLLNMKIADLKKKVISGNAYKEELDTVKRLIENGTLQANMAMTSAIDYLDAHANSGFSTPSQLKERFNALIPNMITTTNNSSETTWWQSTLESLENMISVRNTGKDSAGIDGMIAKMESWLDSEEMENALASLNQLPSTLQQLLSDWKGDLEYWLKGEDAIETIETIAAESYLVSKDYKSEEAYT